MQTVMCALSIEIIFKSFNASIVGNRGRLNEIYEFDRYELDKKGILVKKSNAHDLIVLYESLPEDIRSYLCEGFEIEILNTNKILFMQSRYIYEKVQINFIMMILSNLQRG